MVKKLGRKGDSSAAPPPKTRESDKKKKRRRLVKADPEKMKADASASAPAAAATPNGVATESNRGDSSKKEKMNREGEGSKASRTTGKRKEKDGDKSASGFIFMCSSRTKPECYHHGVFGLPRGQMGAVEKIRPGARLFLYDFDLKLMYGVYKATTRGRMDIVPQAFDGKFPAQVKFSVDLDCLPVPETSFKQAIKENYNSKGRFTQELSAEQVLRLLALFKPLSQSHRRESPIEDIRHPHIVEDRRESYFYDERRPSHHVDARGGPINVRASLLEGRHTMLRQAPFSSAPHHVPLTPELQEVPPMYYHQVAPNSSYHQPRLDAVHERAAADVTVRDPLLSRDYEPFRDPLLSRDYAPLRGDLAARSDPLLLRDYTPLRGDLAARSERLDGLYRSYRSSTSAMGMHQDPSYVTISYENPRSITRVSGPSAPVSTRYSFAGPPAY